jgi:hypothetical protein
MDFGPAGRSATPAFGMKRGQERPGQYMLISIDIGVE